MQLRRRIIQDWTRVEDLAVDADVYRTFEYHVVEDTETARTILTIKLYRGGDLGVRLDPSDVMPSGDLGEYGAYAERRVRHLYANGRI